LRAGVPALATLLPDPPTSPLHRPVSRPNTHLCSPFRGTRVNRRPARC